MAKEREGFILSEKKGWVGLRTGRREKFQRRIDTHRYLIVPRKSSEYIRT